MAQKGLWNVEKSISKQPFASRKSLQFCSYNKFIHLCNQAVAPSKVLQSLCVPNPLRYAEKIFKTINYDANPMRYSQDIL